MSPAVVPATRPEIARETVEGWVRALGHEPESFFIVGRRGYYRDTMGRIGVQERGIYDDAITVVSPRVCESFNANVDPTASPLARPGVAVLQPGRYLYTLGIHNISKARDRRYPALVQAAGVTIRRDGSEAQLRDQWIGLNIHRGGEHTTSSEGCQTIYKPQWDQFLALVRMEADAEGLKRFPYYVCDRAAV